MPNQLFYPKSTFVARANAWSNDLYLPSPKNRTAKLTASVMPAADQVEPVEKLNIRMNSVQVGMILYNIAASPNVNPYYGQGFPITDVDYTTNIITTGSAHNLTPGDKFYIAINEPDPCMIYIPLVASKNDILFLTDAGGNDVDWAYGQYSNIAAAGPMANQDHMQAPFQVIQIRKGSDQSSAAPYDYVVCMWN
jgi:hypothetical protein